MVSSISNLRDVTERFDQAVSQTIAAARGLSEPNANSPDLPSAIVDLSVAEKSVKADGYGAGIERDGCRCA